MHVLACYVSYLAISLALTIWVARVLHRTGRVFLVDAFHGNAELADSINKLLVVGFYLVNAGFIVQAFDSYRALDSTVQIIDMETHKVGSVLVVLGLMHCFNIFILSRLRARAARNHSEFSLNM